jgi:hypothetical protein
MGLAEAGLTEPHLPPDTRSLPGPLPLLLALPPLPLRHRLWVSPEPLSGLLGDLLNLGELATLVVLNVERVDGRPVRTVRQMWQEAREQVGKALQEARR